MHSFPGQVREKFCLLVILVLLSSAGMRAQLCTGSLGDPVVNINFAPGTGLPSVPGYTYAASSCPNDGFYTVTGATSGCFGNAWHTVNSDHGGNGGFMLVNASYTPGDFFVSRVNGLCPSTTYEFAAWVMNVLRFNGIKPNLVFSIETPSGTILQQFSTGDIAETANPAWNQYGFYFKTPAQDAEIVLRIRNNAPGGNGNDIALDDITFRPCGPAITAQIEGYGSSAGLCIDSAGVFNLKAGVSAGFIDPVYFWQQSTDTGKTWKDIPGASGTDLQVNPQSEGIYFYRFSVTERIGLGNAACRVASGNLSISIYGLPLVDAGPDRSLIAGDTIRLMAKVTGKDPIYQWSPPDYLDDPRKMEPLAFPPINQRYSLLVTTLYGCKASDEVLVKAAAGIFVPDAFTPNGDGLNDIWHIPFLDPPMVAAVVVYNVYGNEVYRVSGDVVNWDGTLKGKKQPSGAYIYKVIFNGSRKPLHGTLMLIR